MHCLNSVPLLGDFSEMRTSLKQMKSSLQVHYYAALHRSTVSLCSCPNTERPFLGCSKTPACHRGALQREETLVGLMTASKSPINVYRESLRYSSSRKYVIRVGGQCQGRSHQTVRALILSAKMRKCDTN